jgi:periplasmic protein TonB
MEWDVPQLGMQHTPETRVDKSQSPDKLLRALNDRPAELMFSFEESHSRGAAAASVVSHILMGVVIFLVVRYAPERAVVDIAPIETPREIVWLSEPGPGGGGGGGGNEDPEPPKKVELPGKEKITVPVKKEEPAPVEPPKVEPPPVEELNIPAKTMASAETPLAGVLETPNVAATTSQGSGTGGGGGTGTGTGVGSGQGSGLGPGYGGGTGGGAYRPGNGVSVPRVIREVKPQYTADAMRAKVQGTVWLECVVTRDGSVSDIRIVRSLDGVFGLDQEAVKAARQWKFVPGVKDGEPVPVLITIELTFTLR